MPFEWEYAKKVWDAYMGEKLFIEHSLQIELIREESKFILSLCKLLLFGPNGDKGMTQKIKMNLESRCYREIFSWKF